MKTMPLRDFQREGPKAFGSAMGAEPWLLAGRDKEFILIPVTPANRSAALDLAEGLMAVMALRQDQAEAVAAGLDRLTPEAIDAEIRATRKAMRTGKRSA